jgi:hypothetical protein
MRRWRSAAVAVLLTLIAAGCGQASSATPATVGEHRFAHVHEFPGSGIRIAPPTGTPKVTWRQAQAAAEDFYGPFDSRTAPQVKLASYRDRLRGPIRPVLAWVVVYPDAEVVEFGRPDFAPPPDRVQHCPAYVGVDAISGQLLGAFQTCDPPYRG